MSRTPRSSQQQVLPRRESIHFLQRSAPTPNLTGLHLGLMTDTINATDHRCATARAVPYGLIAPQATTLPAVAVMEQVCHGEVYGAT